MNLTNIKALKPHTSYKKKLNVPIYPLFLTSQFTVDNYRRVNRPKENEILPTISWNPTWCVLPESGIEESPEKIGFIILRHVSNNITNEYWKECYSCIKRFYPKNRILIIDDNSDYAYVTDDPLDNTMIIRSEYTKRGEYLPYYYYLKTNFCETAVILHDSVFIKILMLTRIRYF